MIAEKWWVQAPRLGAPFHVRSPTRAWALAVGVFATILPGVYPQLLFRLADASARTLGVAGITAALR